MDFSHVVIARFYEQVEPIDRGERYKDPLQEAPDAANIGRVAGGGSQLNELGAIETKPRPARAAHAARRLTVVVRWSTSRAWRRAA
jgi:hypothetical protein